MLEVIPTDEIIRLYTVEHIAFKYIAKRYHVQPYIIRELLHKNNIETRWVSHKATIDIKELERLYSVEHLPSTEIAKRFGLTFTTILHALHENNILVHDSHDFNKRNITPQTLHEHITEIKVIEGKRYGIAKCPICQKTRIITLHGKNDKDFTGICPKCAILKRSHVVDIELVKHLYTNKRETPKQISSKLHVSDMTIRSILRQNNIPMRKRGELKIIVPQNSGTLTDPALGDMRRGVEIGLRDKTFYIRVECPSCHQQKWQGMSHFTREQSPLCRKCSMERFGKNHRGENATNWHGGLSLEPYSGDFRSYLKKEIRERDNYTCQICGRHESPKRALVIHHIDYNKKNTNQGNLICVCGNIKGEPSCHGKTGTRRTFWTAYFHSLLIARGIIDPDPEKPKRTNKLQLALA